MRWKISILLIVAAWTQSFAATFSTEQVRRIAAAIRLVVPDTLNAESYYTTLCSYQGRPIRVKTNAWGDVSNVGYQLFSNELLQAAGNEPVMEFIERYLLELDLSLDGRTPKQRMDIDKVVLTKGTLAMLHQVTPQTPFAINKLKRRFYQVKWTVNKHEVALTIPADCQLFIGGNAIDLEAMMVRDLPRIKPQQMHFVPAMLNGLKMSHSDNDNYLAKGESYLSDAIQNSLYLIRIHGKQELVCSQRNAAKSISNIMLTGVFNRQLPMDLVVDKYGYKQDTLHIILQQFINYCQREHCKLFFGIKGIKSGILSGTLFALNEKAAYNHVLSVNVPVSIISGKQAPIKATVYAYVPLQNVTEQFFTKDITNEYEQQK